MALFIALGHPFGPAGSAASISKRILLPSSENGPWAEPSIWDQEKGARGVGVVLSEQGAEGPLAAQLLGCPCHLLQALWVLLPPGHCSALASG